MPDDDEARDLGPDPALDADDEAALEAALADELADETEAGDEATATTVESLGLPMPVLPVDEALALLAGGELELIGRLWVSSNNALLGVVRGGGVEAAVIHKPVIGERPLRDFPDGTLARREVAAFAVSQATGWNIAPPTVLRDGPLGEGMVQLWIRTDPEVDPVDLVNNDDPRLRRIAAFDAAVNNTDRKAGHLLPAPGGHIYGVDHGVTFSPVPKLRTVLWSWRGDRFAEDERAALASIRAGLDGELGGVLGTLLDRIEVAATSRRLDALLSGGRFPQPNPNWPAVPWPPV
jgi:uncharacterized repeat protein (TIGR03843 family)